MPTAASTSSTYMCSTYTSTCHIHSTERRHSSQLTLATMDELLYRALLLSVLAVALLQIIEAFLIIIRAKPAAPPLPPGPWRLPVIGSMHHLAGKLAHRALRDLAAVHGPLMMLQLGETPLVVVSSREVAREVLRTHDANFATRPRLLAGEVVLYGGADILFSPSGEYWRKLRQLCAAEVLGPKRVLSFRHIREQEVNIDYQYEYKY